MRQGGFSLLEAIVALTILASAGLALFAAMSQSVQMVGRAEHARAVDVAMRNALAWMERVNPMQEPQGQQELSDYQLRWNADQIEPPRDGATGYLQPGLYEVGLYRMHLQLWQGGTLQREVVLNRIGYTQVRQPAEL